MDRELYNQMYTLGERGRDVQAQAEVGRTTVSPALARAVCILFALTVLAVPVAQCLQGDASATHPASVFRTMPAAAASGWEGGSAWQRTVNVNRAALNAMNEYERGLEDGSPVRPLALMLRERVLQSWLGASGEQVYAGREGWLFHGPAIDHTTGPGFLTRRHVRKREASRKEWQAELYADPVAAISDFAEQLKRRGIRLIVMPVPTKPQIHPEKFSGRYDGHGEALHNRSFAEFKAALESNGVLVFDCADALADAKRRTGKRQYLANDTHWTPQAVELAATLLSEFIEERVELPAVRAPAYASVESAVGNIGDLARMFNLPLREQTATRQVTRAKSYLWRPDRDADVLVLGDSFTNIYSLDAMGWGEAAGLAEQLSVEMKRPLDRIARNGDGAFATRQILSRELARGRDRLAGKKLVIWQFASSELSVGNWKPLDMTLGESGPSAFVVPEPGKTMMFTGIIHSITAAPRPGTVTYKDHIIAAHLIDLSDEAGVPIEGGQAVVHLWSMRDGVWTPAARFRAGQRITVRVRAWADVADTYEGINRAELDDPGLAVEDPCWAEEVIE